MSEVIMEEEDEQQTFQQHEVVWAKILGWPWWPARIMQISGKKNDKYRVQFFADTSHAYLPSDKLTPFEQGRQRYSTPKGHYRNFAKAFALASKQVDQRSSFKDDARSQCTSRQKLSPPEIQIKNKVEPQPHLQQQKIAQQQNIEAYSPLRLPLRSTKKSIQKRRLPAIQKKLQPEDAQIEAQVSSLLKRYQLDHIPDKFHKLEQAQRKKKLIKKVLTVKQSQEIRRITARMICRVLSKKQISLEQRQKISIVLMESLLANKENGVQGTHRALLQWISNSEIHTIIKTYMVWPVDSKTDNITDCS